MTAVTILVTHLLGTGHLSRALTLARAFAQGGMRPLVVSGGMPAPHLDAAGVEMVALPALRSDGASFTDLLDAEGRPVTPDLMDGRRAAILAALAAAPPDVLVTELFPFGRRMLRQEFLAALAAAGAMPRRPLVLSSVRDILAPPSTPKKAEQAEGWLAHYDAVLVHSDAEVVPLEASWPVTPPVAAKLRYTGFIAPPLPPASHGAEGEILVTAGGGPVGRKLFDVAIGAARLGGRRWRLLVGGGDSAAVCARLNAAAAGAPVTAEPARSDYRALLSGAAAAVGQCGYNTAIDWLQAGVPGVFVPFAEGGEVEQTLRAASLSSRYGYGVVAEDDLTPARLAGAVESALLRGRPRASELNFDGAERTVRIVADMLRDRP